MRLKDKVVVITGAGRGMGREAAVRFAAEGASVIAADVDDKAAGVVDEIRARGGKAEFVCMNVARERDCERLIGAAVAAFGGVDVLYNNAGIFPEADHSVVDTGEEVWDRVFSVNVKGVAFCAKYAVPRIIERGGGAVINVASFVALVGCSVPQDAYTASKGAVVALTKSMAVQFGPRGVRTNAICPGPIETPLLAEWLLKEPGEKAKRLNRIPMGRFGRTDDIVNLALFLASDEATWVNGAALVVDGGITSNYF
ncbi:MAG: glucose 1-dehydrogenase [Deltaproteobacteria bacterium]|nr:glucose 1-dehydrogenase [Deltaproteobacteria bacterium]